jgi:myo-inositol-1(or 4)-monophosphatase
VTFKSQLEFAGTILDETRALVLSLWEDPELQLELKGDQSPVTKVDREAEQLFRRGVSQRFPDHGVLGEEFGLEGGGRRYVWVIDPIDGTQSLVNGIPTFGTFLALLENGKPVLGAIDLPVLNRRVSGAIGLGVRDESGKEIRLDSAERLRSTDVVALGTFGSFARGGNEELFQKIQIALPIARSYYDCFGHYLVATGKIAALFEFNLHPWDIVATEALVEAAGGRVHRVGSAMDITSLRSAVLGRAGAVESVGFLAGS